MLGEIESGEVFFATALGERARRVADGVRGYSGSAICIRRLLKTQPNRVAMRAFGRGAEARKALASYCKSNKNYGFFSAQFTDRAGIVGLSDTVYALWARDAMFNEDNVAMLETLVRSATDLAACDPGSSQCYAAVSHSGPESGIWASSADEPPTAERLSSPEGSEDTLSSPFIASSSKYLSPTSAMGSVIGSALGTPKTARSASPSLDNSLRLLSETAMLCAFLAPGRVLAC